LAKKIQEMVGVEADGLMGKQTISAIRVEGVETEIRMPTKEESSKAKIAMDINDAEESGQGKLTVGNDGSITNRFGEEMVYDSDGNLAPAPKIIGGLLETWETESDILEKTKLAKKIQEMVGVEADGLMGKQTISAIRIEGVETEIRMPTKEENSTTKIAMDINEGLNSGELTVNEATAKLNAINSGLESMREINQRLKSGDLTEEEAREQVKKIIKYMPKPPEEGKNYVSRFKNEEEAIKHAESSGQGKLTVGNDGSITNRFGEEMVYDSDGNLAPAPKHHQAETKNHSSRFKNEEEAIKHAESSGQGKLTVGNDGSVTNSFGEKMVYDSSGNLAPAPKSQPAEPAPQPAEPAPQPAEPAPQPAEPAPQPAADS